MMYGIYVRAKTSDGRFASVDVLDLDERSWRQFVVQTLLHHSNISTNLEEAKVHLSTSLTKAEVNAK